MIFLDVLTFVENIKEKYNIWYSEVLDQIEFIHLNKNFYIYNNEIYVENVSENNYDKLDLSQITYFVTSRDIWLNPFFILLYKLSKFNKNLFVFRPNKREWWIYNDDKINNISKLYTKKNKLLWDIIVPLLYKKDKNSICNFFDSIKSKLWQYIVIKKIHRSIEIE